MLGRAAERFPELNNHELALLVERDWRYMGEDDREVVVL
jgi:hypothetical protein